MGRSLGPRRTGFRYGVVAVVIALVADLRFLFVDPAGTPDWILTVFENYRTTLALAAYLFLGILAAIRVRPDRTEEGVPPALPTLEQVQANLQPPALRDLGRSIFNFVLRSLLLGFAGALVGLLRGSSGRNPRHDAPPAKGTGDSGT